jgi:diguanylate cyclase (GGDEF)-like protein
MRNRNPHGSSSRRPKIAMELAKSSTPTHRMRARIPVFFMVLLLVIQISGFGFIYAAMSRNARDSIKEELFVGERVFNRLLELNSGQLANSARVLAADFAFKKAIATKDAQTLHSVLANHGARINASVMTLVSPDYRVVLDTLHPYFGGQPFAFPGLMKTAKQRGVANALVVIEDHLYQTVVVPVLAPPPIAFVAIGFVMDDKLAGDLKALTSLDITFINPKDDAVFATTLGKEVSSRVPNEVKTLSTRTHATLSILGDEYETLVSPTQQSADIVVVLQRPLSEALEPFRRLQYTLLALTAIGLVSSLVGSLYIARRVTRPINDLMQFAHRIERGDYSQPVTIQQRDEIGDLAAAFNYMREAIAARESTIMELAYQDPLTGLANRALFQDRLNQAISVWKRTGLPVGVLMLDLDHFKCVNDTLGHHFGDLLLKEVGTRLQAEVLRKSDTIARLGGDEFAVLLPMDDSQAAATVAGKLSAALERPIVIDNHIVDAGASIGVASCPEHGEEGYVLLQRADVAMYAAKRLRSGFAIYDPRHEDNSRERLSLLSELRQAVEKDELTLYYQPKVDLATREVKNVEALVRWHHPERGLISPDKFIPFAEQTGYVKFITRWVIQRALRQCAEWNGHGSPLTVSVNLSARDLADPELPQLLAAWLKDHKWWPEWIWLEITESAVMEDSARAVETLERLHGLGIRLSIDDFGTGYSSFAYLKKLPVSELKIDQSFVRGMAGNPDDVIIVRSIIDLAHNMGLKVTAEGVEDEASWNLLKSLGCDLAQGYLVARPLPLEQFENWLSLWRLQTTKLAADPERVEPFRKSSRQLGRGLAERS